MGYDMTPKDKSSKRYIGKKVIMGITVVLALVAVLTFVQLSSAAQGEGISTPPAGPVVDGPDFSNVSPTDEELLAMPPSIEQYIAAHTLPRGILADADLSGSSKTASLDQVLPDGIFSYTIDVVNSGDIATSVEVTDALPAEVAWINHECPVSGTSTCQFDAGVVTWRGTAPAGETVSLSIVVKMKSDAVPGTTVTNTAKIVDADAHETEVSVEVVVRDNTHQISPIQFLPFTILDFASVRAAIGVPNSNNTWRLSWVAGAATVTGYEYEEADNPAFAQATSFTVGLVDFVDITRQPSPSNVYYYRVRPFNGSMVGPWSNVVSVVGGYYDDFEDPSTGWAVRRGTHREDVNGFYENGKYVTMVTSRWDWLVASPLRPAPRVPYVIDFEARTVSQGYAHSAGGVFGGDWDGQTCPPENTGSEAWARHSDCFNHFYNTNGIYNDTDQSNVTIGLLFERVDQLKWRPNDGGSPLKRVGDIPTSVRVYRNIDPKGWNHYRIEVRADGIRVYAAKRGAEPRLQYEYEDTRWITSPYFGFFTSTDIIENSTWRFDYIQVMPLDE